MVPTMRLYLHQLSLHLRDPSVAMFEPSVSYDIQMVKGIKNFLFGGEGLFFVSLTGPGRVWLQTMPMSKLAGAIRQYMPKAEGSGESGINLKLG